MSFELAHRDDCDTAGNWKLVRRTLDLRAFGINIVDNLGMARTGLVSELGLSDDPVEYHLDNLIRLRLIRKPSGVMDDELEMVTLTEFGRAFVHACRPPSQPDPPVRFTNSAQVMEQAGKNRQRLNQRSSSPG